VIQKQHQPDDPELHQLLQDIPSLRAPDSLLSNVMASIGQRQAAWCRRPATTWPLGLQLTFGLVSIALLAGLTWLAPGWSPATGGIDLHDLILEPMTRIIAFFGTAETLFRAGSLVGRVTLGPALLVLAALASIFYLALFGMATALWRSATGMSR